MAKADDTTTNVDAVAEEAITDVEQLEVITEKEMLSSKGTAKAGKRSAKALHEAEELAAKEERKLAASEDDTDDKPRQTAKPTRSRLERQGKKFREAAKLIEEDKQYSLKEAVALAQKTNPAKFDASVEVHVNLNVDPRHADQNIRDNLVLPAGTGKSIRVAVFAEETAEGADLQGVEEITKQLEKGEMNFDILIATPSQMPKLGKFARALGPRGLMPNPKSGTVTTDVAKAVREAKAGRVEYRVDSTGIVHLPVGKVSFTTADLQKNVEAVFASIKGNKPASVKGTYVKAVYLTTSMGPSITVANNEV
jgi:large subunit ribosomal protein L1